jgi:hypothetical protein
MTYRVIPCFLHVPEGDDAPLVFLNSVQCAVQDMGASLSADEDQPDRRTTEDEALCYTSTEFQTLPECED